VARSVAAPQRQQKQIQIYPRRELEGSREGLATGPLRCGPGVQIRVTVPKLPRMLALTGAAHKHAQINSCVLSTRLDTSSASSSPGLPNCVPRSVPPRPEAVA
jgi:hypothetical protein